MTSPRSKNRQRGSFIFSFQPEPGEDSAPLVEAILACFSPDADARVTIRGEFKFDTAKRLSELAAEAEPYYEPADDSIAPPLLQETVDEALELMLEIQDQRRPSFSWETIPTHEMPQPTLHALYRMVAAEWVLPDDFSTDIGVAAVPEDAGNQSLPQTLRPWGLSVGDLFRRVGV